MTLVNYFDSTLDYFILIILLTKTSIFRSDLFECLFYHENRLFVSCTFRLLLVLVMVERF